MLNPCLCKGSIKFVHKSCLLDWANLSKSRINTEKDGEWFIKCELCKGEILVKTKLCVSFNPQNEFRERFSELWWISLIFIFGVIYGLFTTAGLIMNIFEFVVTINTGESFWEFLLGKTSRINLLTTIISIFNSFLFFVLFFIKIEKKASEIKEQKAENLKSL